MILWHIVYYVILLEVVHSNLLGVIYRKRDYVIAVIKNMAKVVIVDKYEITQEQLWLPGDKIIRQIRALRAFGDVKAGDLGGWVESENILSHEGNCWIDVDSWVLGRSSIKDDSYVGGSAVIISSSVSGFSRVTGNARIWLSDILDYAEVSGNANIMLSIIAGHGKVSGEAESDKSMIIDYFCLCGCARSKLSRLGGGLKAYSGEW